MARSRASIEPQAEKMQISIFLASIHVRPFLAAWGQRADEECALSCDGGHRSLKAGRTPVRTETQRRNQMCTASWEEL